MATIKTFALFSLIVRVEAQLPRHEDCPLGVAGGRGYRWPRTNPALVAPVVVSHDYRVYHDPLEAEMTAEAISIKVPPDMFASFNMSNAQGKTQEHYALRAMELRKPGMLPEGSSQVLSHVLELVLIHEDTAHKGTWATVVLPFAVAVDPETDLLSSLLAGSRLPQEFGQREPLLMRSAQPLDLGAAFKDVSFLTYWTTLPSRCSSADDVPARQLLRNSTLDMSQSTFATALRALQAAPASPPLTSPTDAWLVRACPVPANGSQAQRCKPMEAEDLSQPLLEAQTLQAQALSNLRAKKTVMDAALLELSNPSNETYSKAVAARDNLRNAEAELDAAAGNVARYEAWQSQARRAVWTPTPPRMSADEEGVAAQPPPSGAALLAASRARRREASPGAAGARRGPLQGDCLALGLSPIAIQSATAVSQASASQTPQSIGFSNPSLVQSAAASARPTQAQLRVFNTGEYVRIVVPPHAGAALGSFSVGGRDRAVTFADLHVPGEHTVDGKKADAELQLVHLPSGGGPAIVVSILLDQAKDSTNNTGLTPFLAASRGPRSEGPAEVGPAPLAAMHAGIAAGSVARYFRYNGTLTRSPCRLAEWFVLEDRGVIGAQQLASLHSALPDAGTSGEKSVPADRRPPFTATSLVLRGVQSLYGEEPLQAEVLAHEPVATAEASPHQQIDHPQLPNPGAEQHPHRLIDLLGKFRRPDVQQHASAA
mmetsp:Transcript_92473/g.258475  ORF Transcript_92473/g.258475 Transcript_92473/m.258475 type:complete len:714 (-) Transcript_92473:103-2244(-)